MRVSLLGGHGFGGTRIAEAVVIMRAASVIELAHEAPEEVVQPHVLVVDEDSISAHAASRALTRGGCHVVTVDSLAGARQALAGQRFDMVVSDVWVGDGTGIDVFDAARAAGVLSVTFLGGDPSLPSCMAFSSGTVRYLCKPVDTSRLVAAVRAKGCELG